MSRIMPSGNGAFDWVPKLPTEDGLTKTASNNDGTVQEERDYRDDLFEAAKKVVANYECAQEGDLGGEEFVPGDSDAVEFEGDVNEVSDEGDEGDAVECLEEAKDAIERAVDCLDGGADEFEAEVELEVEDEEVDVEGGLGCMTEDKDDKCCECCGCDPCCCDDRKCASTDDEDDEAVEASDEDSEEDEVVEAGATDWVKVAEISPKNRKKLVDYWSKQLGYPKDFVKLMVKDYEK
jgi:hypothetical protein